MVVGKAQYGYLPNDQGGIVDDLLIYRIGEEEYDVGGELPPIFEKRLELG